MEKRTEEWFKQSDYDMDTAEYMHNGGRQMDKRAASEIVTQFHKGIEARGIRPLKIILYGSHAAGDSREGSDIDTVVISHDFIDKSFWERIDILTDVIYEIFAPIEVTALTQEEWERGDSFVTDFARNGEVLFAALRGGA